MSDNVIQLHTAVPAGAQGARLLRDTLASRGASKAAGEGSAPLPAAGSPDALAARVATEFAARREPLIDEATGLIDQGAVRRRQQELYDAPARREHRARYEGAPLRYWQDNHLARAHAQASREASEQHNRWINEHIRLEYTPDEQNELERLNYVMTSAPIDPRGKAIWEEAALAHRIIRDRVRARAVAALFEPKATGAWS